jgi:penicillin-binding protein 1A
MDMFLIKILAAFLALSQVTTRPDAITTSFDPDRDAAAVTQIMRDGCAHMRKAFDVESIDLDDLIKTAMDDPNAFSAEIKALHGLKFDDLILVYRQFCKNEDVKDSPVDIGAIIRFYDGAMADLPDAARLRALRTAGPGGVMDGNGERFADLSESNRRIWVPLDDIPLYVQKAFIAAEDKRFYEHQGVDERGLIRAMISNLAKQGRPQGGSTITQQVVKNLLVGDDVTYERKMREVILASRVEHTLGKSEILETYLNTIYLGRGAYGIELAARTYFGKPASALTLTEGAMLAALPKGPTYYSPDRHPDRTQNRLAYVITRMQEDGTPGADAVDVTKTGLPRMVAYDRSPRGRPATTSSIMSPARRGLPPASRTSRPPGSRCTRRSVPTFRRRPKPRFRKGLRNTRCALAGSNGAARKPTSAMPCARSKPPAGRRANRGSRRSPPRACRSTTCTGGKRSFSDRTRMA